MTYETAKKKALERDGHKCLICGGTRQLAPHHLIGGKLRKAMEAVLENIVTLCFKCHEMVEARREGYADWKVQSGPNPEASLDLFWIHFRADRIFRIMPTFAPGDRSEESHALAVQASDPEQLDVAMATGVQEALKDEIQKVSRSFMVIAALVLEIHEKGYWRVNHETLEEFLQDPKVGIERTRFFRLVKLARYLKANPGMPMLNERTWTRDILPLTDSLDKTKIKGLCEQAEHVPYAEFAMVCDGLKAKAARPDVEVMFHPDMVVKQGNNQIGWVRRAWANDECQLVLLKIKTVAAEAILDKHRLDITIQ